jgi:peptidoglycan hydrolase-like protein with peptidoglycan-binding domain
VRIDQSPVNTALDETADVLDVENGAATIADIVPWVKAARNNFAAAVRPGQRQPMVYCNQSTLTAVANALVAGNLTNVPIWLAIPGLPLTSAENDVSAANGPYPTYGIQYAWDANWDADIFLSSWLTNVSGRSGDTIMAGDYGPAVQACQTRLNVWAKTAGLTSLKVDGGFGPNTLVGVQGFQKFKKLSVDGVVGATTWTALNVSPVPVPPPPVPIEYAAPVGLRGNTVWLNLTWDAVPAVQGKKPAGYTVAVYRSDGTTLVGTKVFPSNTGQVLLALGEAYQIHVWANGGQVPPPHATLNVTA